MKNSLFIVILLCAFASKTLSQVISPMSLTKRELPKTSATTSKGTNSGYISNDKIKRNYLIQQKKTLLSRLDTLQSKLNNDSSNETPMLSRTQQDSLLNITNIIMDSVKTLKIEIKKHHELFLIDTILYKRQAIFPNQDYSKALSKIIHNSPEQNFQLLSNTGLSLGNRSGAIFSEVVSGQLSVFRTSLGIMLTKSTDTIDIENETFQRLISAGGNTVLNFDYPCLFFSSRERNFNFLSRLFIKAFADLPQVGTATNQFAGGSSCGVNIYGDASLDNRMLTLYGNFDLFGTVGTNNYIENLNVKNNIFLFGQLSIGVIIGNNFNISISLPAFSSEPNLRFNSKSVTVETSILNGM